MQQTTHHLNQKHTELKFLSRDCQLS